MKRRLVIASLNYSSWSTRAWLALTRGGVAFDTHLIELFVAPDWRDKLLAFSGAGKVPILIDGSLSVHETLAIAEYAAELSPEAGLWPEDRALRARARAISSEMATNFTHLRNEMSMNARRRAVGFVPSEGAKQEIARVQEIWDASLQTSGGPFLFGGFTIADCMYMPVVSRFRTYGVELPIGLSAYAASIWEEPTVRAWWEIAKTHPAIPKYDEGLELIDAP